MVIDRRVAHLGGIACIAVALLACLTGCGPRTSAPSPSAADAMTLPNRGQPVRIQLDVDATDLPRGLLHARETIPVTSGLVWLWFPKWMPGTHAPCGPVENLGGLRFSLPSGERLTWRRDDVELNRFGVTVPPGADSLVVRIDYICNQPTENSKGIDSAGNATLGVINWNTCLLYPEGHDEDAVRVQTTVHLPQTWKQACAVTLTSAANVDGTIADNLFTGAEVSLRELIDSPLIGGEHLARYDVSSQPEQGRPLRLVVDALAADQAGVTLDAEAQAAFVRLADEVHEQFPGRTPFDTYHLLAVASDVIEPTGLEHQSCSLNAFQAGALTSAATIAEQLAHEFCHAWCGKYRRPAGMYTRDFHTPERTHLLWVYEGLDMYLGEIMASRAQLGTNGTFADRLQGEAQQLALNTGRDWRSVEDTAIANWQLRGPSAHWGQMRRDQDYYLEGMLLWLEIDGIIRGESHGEKSLDDFCCSFFRVDDEGAVIPKPYGIDDVVAALQATHPHDWRSLIDERMMRTTSELSFAGFERCGWRMRLADRRAEPWVTYATTYQYLDESWSLGLVLQKGVIRQVIPGSPADRARLSPGMRVTRIGGKPMTIGNLDQSLIDSQTTGSIALRCQLAGNGARTRDVTLAYAGGPRYFTLERIGGTPDLLATIGSPRSARGKAYQQQPATVPAGTAAEPGEVEMEVPEDVPLESASQDSGRVQASAPTIEPAVEPAIEPAKDPAGAPAEEEGTVVPARERAPEPAGDPAAVP